MLGGGVDAETLVAALGAGPPPPECRWGRRPHRGAAACRLLDSHKKTNTIFRVDDPAYDMDIYIFKVSVFIKQANYE